MAEGVFGGTDIGAAAMVFEVYHDDPVRTGQQIHAMVEATSPRPWPAKSLDENLADMREFVEHIVDGFGTKPAEEADLATQIKVEGDEKDALFVWPTSQALDESYVYEVVAEHMIRELRGRMFIGAQSLWLSPKVRKFGRASEDPERLEGMAVFGTDGLRYVVYIAILRRDDEEGASLEKWQVHDEGTAAQASSLFVKPSAIALFNRRRSRASRVWLMTRPPEWWTDEKLAAWEVVIDMINATEHGDYGQVTDEHMNAWCVLFEIAERTPNPEIDALAMREDLWDYMPEAAGWSPAHGIGFDVADS